MTSIPDLEDVVRQQQEELTQLRAEVAAWRSRYESSRKREMAFTNSASEVAPLYTALDLEGSAGTAFETPGTWPFTRGIHATGYRGKLWTMRQFAASARRVKRISATSSCSHRVRRDFPWRSTSPR